MKVRVKQIEATINGQLSDLLREPIIVDAPVPEGDALDDELVYDAVMHHLDASGIDVELFDVTHIDYETIN